MLREYAMPLAKQALSTLSARYEFTPRGPILIEIFPKHDDFAVRTVGLPGHDRRARRLLRPRRDDGFAAGAPAGRVPVGSDAVARAGARRHAADVEPAAAAVADRRHLGLRGEEGARRVGPRDGPHLRRDAQSRRNAEAARPELRRSRIRRRSRSPTSRRRCSSSTSSRRTATRACASWCAPYAQGIDTDAALKSALDTDFDQLQVGFDQTRRAHVRRRCAARWRCPKASRSC